MKMSNLEVQAPPVNFSNHNKSHTYTSTCDMGQLIPIWWQRVYPNDRVNIQHEVFCRFAPLVYPLLAEVNLKVFTFYTPSIATWNHWKKFYSEKPILEAPKKPFTTIAHLFSEIGEEVYGPCTLADYLGLPMAQFYSGAKNELGNYLNDGIDLNTINQPINLEPFIVYQKIWNRFFRDENLELDIFDEDQTNSDLDPAQRFSVEENLFHNVIDGRGNDILSISNTLSLGDLFTLRYKSWEKDLFTSALPSPQFGEPVQVPIDTTLEFDGTGITDLYKYDNGTSTPLGYDGRVLNIRVVSDALQFELYNDPEDPTSGTRWVNINLNNVPNMKAVAGNFTINELRMASAVQRYQESLMRAGHRYEEQMRYQFDQIVPNSSLREPELIAASSIPIQISEISQTSESSQTALGTQAGQAFGYQNGNNTKTTFHSPDNGYLMSIMCIVPRTSYMNGLDHEWQLFDRLDYFNPVFEHVGDEPIYGKEVYLSDDDTYNDGEFGYIPRYSREKVGLNRTTGEMTNTLLRMNLSRNFNGKPFLNKEFIHVDNSVNRGFAIEDSNIAQHIWFIAKNNILMRRPMQYNPIPKLL